MSLECKDISKLAITLQRNLSLTLLSFPIDTVKHPSASAAKAAQLQTMDGVENLVAA